MKDLLSAADQGKTHRVTTSLLWASTLAGVVPKQKKKKGELKNIIIFKYNGTATRVN